MSGNTEMRTIIVTGANRGIGRAICDSVLSHPSLSSTPVTLYATSRAGSDLGIKTTRSDQKVIYPSLDIADAESVAAFDKTLSESKQPVDILINNAGINVDENFSYDNVKKTLDTNYRGTLAMCKMILPHLTTGNGTDSRVVSLSSTGSSLSLYSDDIKHRFRTVRTLDEVEQMAQEYISTVKENKLAQSGWPKGAQSYSVSKALMNAFTRILGRENPEVKINCCCPGWVETDMGKIVGANPPKTPEEGARIPVRLALGDIGGVSGIYWGNDSISGRGEGKVQDW